MDYKSQQVQAQLALLEVGTLKSLHYNAANAARLGYDEGDYNSVQAIIAYDIIEKNPGLRIALGKPQEETTMSLIGWWSDVGSAADLALKAR